VKAKKCLDCVCANASIYTNHCYFPDAWLLLICVMEKFKGIRLKQGQWSVKWSQNSTINNAVAL